MEFFSWDIVSPTELWYSVKMWIQPAWVCVKTFSRFNVNFSKDSLEKIHFEGSEERKENFAFFLFFSTESHSFYIMIAYIINLTFSNKAWHSANRRWMKGLSNPPWIKIYQSKFYKLTLEGYVGISQQ